MSREFAFLLNNWILLGCALFVFFATMLPTLSEAFDRRAASRSGPPFFNKWMIPLGLTLLFLAGAAPLLAYRRTTRERLLGAVRLPARRPLVVTVAVLAIFLPADARADLDLPRRACTCRSRWSTSASSRSCSRASSQEFWRGMRVRAPADRLDPVTSLIGLVLAKRRKYGGYIVHLGVAVMFFGFAGKAYEGMEDFTLTKPGRHGLTTATTRSA